MRTLVAGVGNIFLSDDGFGSEVVRAMGPRPMPDGVEVVDFGIRGVHLAYQLLEGYDTLVVIDAAQRGNPPGTVSLVEIATSEIPDAKDSVEQAEAPLVDAHGLEPAAILSMLGSMGGQVDQVLLVACEPLTVEDGIGLSEPVSNAIPVAVELLDKLLDELLRTADKEVSR